jgi:hypothetical protein
MAKIIDPNYTSGAIDQIEANQELLDTLSTEHEIFKFLAKNEVLIDISISVVGTDFEINLRDDALDRSRKAIMRVLYSEFKKKMKICLQVMK